MLVHIKTFLKPCATSEGPGLALRVPAAKAEYVFVRYDEAGTLQDDCAVTAARDLRSMAGLHGVSVNALADQRFALVQDMRFLPSGHAVVVADCPPVALDHPLARHGFFNQLRLASLSFPNGAVQATFQRRASIVERFLPSAEPACQVTHRHA